MKRLLCATLALLGASCVNAQELPQDVSVVALPVSSADNEMLHQSFMATHGATLPPECQNITEPFSCTFTLAYSGTAFAGFGINCPAPSNLSPLCQDAINRSYAMPESVLTLWKDTYCKQAAGAFAKNNITLSNVPGGDFCSLPT